MVHLLNHRARIAGCQKLLQIIFRRVLETNDPRSIDKISDRNYFNPEKIKRIRQNRPFHLLPLHEKSGSFRVLLLNDSQSLQLPGLHQFTGPGMPNGHTLATPCSPRCKHMKDRLLPEMIPGFNQLSGRDISQLKIGKRPTHFQLGNRSPCDLKGQQRQQEKLGHVGVYQMLLKMKEASKNDSNSFTTGIGKFPLNSAPQRSSPQKAASSSFTRQVLVRCTL